MTTEQPKVNFGSPTCHNVKKVEIEVGRSVKMSEDRMVQTMTIWFHGDSSLPLSLTVFSPDNQKLEFNVTAAPAA